MPSNLDNFVRAVTSKAGMAVLEVNSRAMISI